MKHRIIFFAICIILLSCEKDEKEPFPPSFIEFELQYFGTSPGGIFLEKQILTRKTYAYQTDDENNVSGGITIEPGGDTYIVIAGYGNNIHPTVKRFDLTLPNRGESNYVGNYNFDPDNSEQKNFKISIETTYSSELKGANSSFGGVDTEFNVAITEYGDDCIKGSFSGELVYYNFETSTNGLRTLTLDEEISYVNKPIINGKFEIYTP